MPKDRIVAQKAPYEVELQAGKNYAWCRCGHSQNQPYCDGSHKGTGIDPVVFRADASGTHYLCGCKRTSTEPFCDGTHDDL